MKIWLPIVLLTLASTFTSIEAANHQPIWKIGQLVLNNGMQLTGELNYNWRAEIVQVRQAGTIKAYSAHQISEFSYFDQTCNELRRFSAVNYPVKKGLLRPIFMEKFGTGPFTVYRRLRHQREPIPLETTEAYGRTSAFMEDYDNFTYYVFTDETFVNLDRFSRELWPRMVREFGPELKHYAAVRTLDMTTTLSRLLLISQYNHLKEEAEADKSYAMPGME